LQTIFDLISEIGSLRALSHPPTIFLPSDDRLPRWFMAHVLHSPGNEKKKSGKKRRRVGRQTGQIAVKALKW